MVAYKGRVGPRGFKPDEVEGWLENRFGGIAEAAETAAAKAPRRQKAAARPAPSQATNQSKSKRRKKRKKR